MSRFSKTVRVMANPYHRLDHKGRPCCAVPLEPVGFGRHLGFVGAQVDPEKTTVQRKRAQGDLRPAIQDTVFKFSKKSVEVEKTSYYLGELKGGSLLPADERSAKWARIPYVPVEAALAKSKANSEAEFEREYGEGSLAVLRGEPEPVATPVPTPETPAPVPPAPALEPETENTNSEGDPSKKSGGARRGKAKS